MIFFTKHAQEKFKILENRGVSISRDQVLKTLSNPDRIDHSRLPLLIAQRKIDANHVLRVVYRWEASDMKVITFYPGRTKQYS